MIRPSTYDIFCTVIDNYGDVGVSWRLARQLANEYGSAVRLWIDDLWVLQRMCPDVMVNERTQHIAGVEVYWWRHPFAEVEPGDVAIAAFVCALPDNYVEAMARRPHKTLWINLEYLSAEDWVANCHGLPSPQPQYALDKYFFFPGFATHTGGLLRERELLAQRHAFQADPAARANFFARFGLGEATAARVISLFAYENSALQSLLTAWTNASQSLWCLVPEGKPLAGIADFFGESNLAAGAICRSGALTVAVLPFLAQDDYDRLLWSCDLNFVRGEDSFLRAQWAGRPLIWHIYPQQEGAHWQKLNAFLNIYTELLPASATNNLANAWRAWNGAGEIATAWRALEADLPTVSAHAQRWAEQLVQRGNLAATLVQFCANHV